MVIRLESFIAAVAQVRYALRMTDIVRPIVQGLAINLENVLEEHACVNRERQENLHATQLVAVQLRRKAALNQLVENVPILARDIIVKKLVDVTGSNGTAK
jgi:hypothetical protein